MERKTYFHVTDREYTSGDIIKPYFNTDISDPVKRMVEMILEKTRPSDAPNRNKSIFVFKTLSNAKQYSKDSKNKNIYIVVTNNPITAWYDMNWVDAIYGEVVSYINPSIARSKSAAAYRYGKYYWGGKSATELSSRFIMVPPVWEGVSNTPMIVVKKK